MNNAQTYAKEWCSYPLSIADQQEHIQHYERLFDEIQPGDPALLYWSLAQHHGLVLGISQKPESLNQEALRERDLPVYRRRAGGTAVLVGPGLLCLDVILPAGHPLITTDIVESYRWFGEAWVETLRVLGIETRTISAEEAHSERARLKQAETHAYEALMNRSCYGTLSPYEVVVGKRKVVGLCMVRRRQGSLLQAGVVLDWESDLLAHVLGQTAQEQELLRSGLPERAIGLNRLSATPPGINAIIHAFEEVVAMFTHVSIERATTTSETMGQSN
ncbi:lipoate--protein ligase family protein [Ktedonobacter robiniae]|uniref:Ligase n=1 Tax=Ktedonobacter robiniae TaxID=2778365 RepID=A0ABQ3UHM4_9CHLR|nr:lipoate--protein ligase family protein [Ktedonobacter robiniae]GHO52208.1 ligase [Ktedonobacter robiniae]